MDSDSPFTSDVWNSDTCKYTGLGGSGNPTCVTTGPFAFPGWRVTPSAGSSCLRRSHRNGVPDCVAVQDVLDATTAQFNDFHIGLEVVLHNTVHVSVGGTMSSVEASNAPEFFLHLASLIKSGETGKRKVSATKYITTTMMLIQCLEQSTPLEIYMTWTTNLTQ